jgi:DNA helicase II / ATP-dependent DNA helicase PcrA
VPGGARRPGSTGRGPGTGPGRVASAPPSDLNPGDRVTHDTFGLGTVVLVEGAGDRAVAHVDFRAGGVKRLLLRYAPVVKL